jgi:hypothetical protein
MEAPPLGAIAAAVAYRYLPLPSTGSQDRHSINLDRPLHEH